MRRALAVLLPVLTLLVVAGCTASQQGWWHDNIPLIGSLFQPFVPLPPPLWQAMLGGVADLFTQHPAEAVPATVATVTGVAHLAGRIPGTHRHARRLEKGAAKRAAAAHVDATLKHWDATKAADHAKRKAEKAAAHAAARAAKAAATPSPSAKP